MSIALALCLLCSAGPATAATTAVVAPSAAREAAPCTTATPCDYEWALANIPSPATIEFESGQYDYVPTGSDSGLDVFPGITLAAAPGDTSRPVIEQTTGYATCNCATMSVDGTIQDLEIDQAAGGAGKTAGAIDLGAGGLVERSILTGIDNGMYFTGNAGMSDTLVIANHGVAVDAENNETDTLDNVTAIANGTSGGDGVAIRAVANSNTPSLIATNTIARGDTEDVYANASSSGHATITLHYSDARSAMETENTSGPSTATVTDTDHPMHADPVFTDATSYTQAAGSPTIDTGTADIASGSLDLYGQPRVVGPLPDIGATEWQGAAPSSTTGPASAVSDGVATLSGSILAGDLTTTWHFNYGRTTSYGSQSAAQTLTGTTAAQDVKATLTGLTPGTRYHYQLVAGNGRGTGPGADGTFTTTGVTPDKTPPTISHSSLTHRTFAVSRSSTALSARSRKHRKAPPKGTVIRFTLSEIAAVKLTIAHKVAGQRDGRKCVASKARHIAKRSRCSLVKTDGTLTRRSEHAGADSIAFSGRIGRHALKPGPYALQIGATDPSGNKAKARTLTFTVVKP